MSGAQPVMRSLPLEDYPGRFLSVDADAIVSQRAMGWPDFHPEDFCHRCGAANVSWYTDSTTWNDAMEDETRWNGIVCVPCFIALTEDRVGGCAWRLTRDKYGNEVLSLLHVGDPGRHPMTGDETTLSPASRLALAHYRKRAEECRAEATRGPVVLAAECLNDAARWDALADELAAFGETTGEHDGQEALL